MNYDLAIRAGFYVCSAVALIFLVETIFIAVARPLVRRSGVNRRLRALNDGAPGEKTLLTLKAERGIGDGDLAYSGWLRRLLIQSGLRVTLNRFLLILLALSGLVFAALKLLTLFPLWLCAVLTLVIGILAPIQIVRFIRSSRQKKFAIQLPEALDVVVRSLRSGHPVPVALGMVGREMADPVGTEFGLVIDEMTYGLDMSASLHNLADRVGIPDLSLMVTAVSLQATAGGNLSEVLNNLSKVLRERFQLRRKVRSLSAEGRFSAYGLTFLPIFIFFGIYVQNPDFYNSVWDEPVFKLAMGGLIGWSLIGDIIMFKMINFKY